MKKLWNPSVLLFAGATFGFTLAVIYLVAWPTLWVQGDQMRGAWLGASATILAAVLALLAAYVAIQPVRDQLGEMRRQSAVMSRDVFVKLAVELESERALAQLYRTTLARALNWARNFPTPGNKAAYDDFTRIGMEVEKEVDACWVKLRDTISRYPVEDSLWEARNAVLEEAYKLDMYVRTLATVALDSRTPDARAEEVREIREEMHRQFAATRKYQRALDSRISDAWEQVRLMEAIAIGNSNREEKC